MFFCFKYQFTLNTVLVTYPVVEQDFRLVSHSFIPQEPHGVIDDERGEQVAMDVNPGALQTLAGYFCSKK